MDLGLDPAVLFGGSTDDPVAVSSHGFTSKNAKKSKAYLDHPDKYFIDHKITAWIEKLVEDAPTFTRPQLKHQYEGINNDITQGMLAAECKVCPSMEFKYEWSVTLDRAGHCVQYWQVQYSDLKNNSTSHLALGRIFKQAGLKDGDDDPLWDLEKVLEKLKAARAALKVAIKTIKINVSKGLLSTTRLLSVNWTTRRQPRRQQWWNQLSDNIKLSSHMQGLNE